MDLIFIITFLRPSVKAQYEIHTMASFWKA